MGAIVPSEPGPIPICRISARCPAVSPAGRRDHEGDTSRQAQGDAASAAGCRQIVLSLDRILSRDCAESGVELALPVVVVDEETAAVDGVSRLGYGDLEMHMLEHGTSHGAFIAEVLPRRHGIADLEVGFPPHRAAGHMGVVGPLAVGMRDPDIVVMTERCGAARLLLAVAVLDGDDPPRCRRHDAVGFLSGDRVDIDAATGTVRREIVEYLHLRAVREWEAIEPPALRGCGHALLVRTALGGTPARA